MRCELPVCPVSVLEGAKKEQQAVAGKEECVTADLQNSPVSGVEEGEGASVDNKSGNEEENNDQFSDGG